MPRTITLDALDRGNLRVLRLPDGSLRLEASYAVRAGNEVVKVVTRDVTELLTPADIAALTNAYNSAFERIEAAELAL